MCIAYSSEKSPEDGPSFIAFFLWVYSIFTGRANGLDTLALSLLQSRCRSGTHCSPFPSLGIVD